jgi:hypothetical protein
MKFRESSSGWESRPVKAESGRPEVSLAAVREIGSLMRRHAGMRAAKSASKIDSIPGAEGVGTPEGSSGAADMEDGRGLRTWRGGRTGRAWKGRPSKLGDPDVPRGKKTGGTESR